MATRGDHERVLVTLLIGEENWASWKVQMRHQLQSKKIWKLVKGEEMLAEAAEQTVKDAFEERSIDATMRPYVSNCGFACASFGLPGEDLEPAGEAEDSRIEAVPSAEVFWSQDGRR